MARREAPVSELQEKVVYINRVSKVVKGGRRFALTALVVVGDGAGNVGVGMGKSQEVPIAIKKGIEDAKKNMFKVPVINGTIPHEIVRRVRRRSRAAEAGRAGYRDHRRWPRPRRCSSSRVSPTCSASRSARDNALNMVKAAAEGLRSLSSAEEVARRRGKTVAQIYGWEE